MQAERALITRPRPQAERFAAEMRVRFGAGLEAVIAPLQEILCDGALPDLTGAAGLILTSENGARCYAARGGPAGLAAWCVGDRTAAAARAAGLHAVSAGGDAGALAARIVAARPAGRLWHLHGAHVTGDLAGRLAEAGLDVAARAIYAQRAVPLPAAGKAALAAPGALLVPVFSPRSAALLAPDLAGAVAEVRIAAISRAAAAPFAMQAGPRVEVAPTPDAAGVLHALASLRG